MIDARDGFYIEDRDLFLKFCELDRTYRGNGMRRPAIRRTNCRASIEQNRVIDEHNRAEEEQVKATAMQIEVSINQQPKPFRSSKLIAERLGCSVSKVEHMRSIHTHGSSKTIRSLSEASIGIAEAYKNAMQDKASGKNVSEHRICDNKCANAFRLILLNLRIQNPYTDTTHKLTMQDYNLLEALLGMLCSYQVIEGSHYSELIDIIKDRKARFDPPIQVVITENEGAS